MRWRLPPLLIAVGLLGIAAGTASAGAGLLRLSWDGCDPVQPNKNFSGAGTSQTATLVLSVSGSDLTNNGHRTVILIGPDIPDAWRFDADGCQSGQLEILHSGVSKACPAFQGTLPLGLYQFSYDAGARRGRLDVTNTYDKFTPQPGQRYTLWQARFHHTYSEGGSSAGSTCGSANEALCFRISSELLPPELLLPDLSKELFVMERDWVTWQDPVNAMNCPQINAQESTWGAVKGLYR